MAQFSNFQNILPDPNNSIGDAGQTTGSAGPGFASVKITSEEPYLTDRTNSGRLLARAIAYHKWKINISYNPMTREQFDPIYMFLLQRRGPLNPFYVSLPQHRVPKDSTFATHAAAHNLTINETNGYAAGTTSVTVDGPNYVISTKSTPKPGDLFTIDGNNSNHEKAYMVTRVETPTDYKGTAPATNNLRIHFIPGLAKSVADQDELVFNAPLIKVAKLGNVQEYSLDANNLYKFSLNLEEVQ